MRLIDADMLEDDGANYTWERSFTSGFIKKEYRFVNRLQIDNSPTVEAIPIEWMYEWRMKNNEQYSVGISSFSQMLKDWEKENENRVDK